TAIRGLRERRDDALDLAGVRHVDRGHLHLERRRHSLDDAKRGHPSGTLYSKVMKPVTLPPGRARLSTKPAPTGSPVIGKMMAPCVSPAATAPRLRHHGQG